MATSEVTSTKNWTNNVLFGKKKGAFHILLLSYEVTPPSRAKSKLLSATLKNNREISAKSCLSSVRPTTARRGEVPDLRLLASGVSTGSVRPENPVYTNGRRPTIRPPPRPPTQLPNTVRWRGLAKAARIHFRAGLVRLVHRLLLPTRIPTARLHLA